ncbi:hypothetical protein [Ensifer aridi]|uniref:hypothetical protein n=1 Tax=Ensifer aridi TaxID=1708715 RepID=UPI000A0F5B35|nr:hypothetical protein [Ensifer aridi]
MPEAVASNSIPVSNRQPRYGWKQHFSEEFENIDYMLAAFREMNSALYETKQDHSEVSYGVYLIHGLIMDRLKVVAGEAKQVIANATERAALPELESGFDEALLERIGEMAGAALLDAGYELDMEDATTWPEGLMLEHTGRIGRFYNELIAKLNEAGRFDLLTVGSLLPWLELRIRREVMGAEAARDLGDTSLRDRLIVEQAKSGVSAADLSQAFNLRRGAVERIIARLTVEEEEEEARKAV